MYALFGFVRNSSLSLLWTLAADFFSYPPKTEIERKPGCGNFTWTRTDCRAPSLMFRCLCVNCCLHALVFPPFVVEIHSDSPPITFRKGFGTIITLLHYQFFPCWEDGKTARKSEKYSHMNLHLRKMSKRNNRCANWGYFCFHGNCINLLFVCHLFNRIGKKSRLRLASSSASSVCHHELWCINTAFMF